VCTEVSFVNEFAKSRVVQECGSCASASVCRECLSCVGVSFVREFSLLV